MAEKPWYVKDSGPQPSLSNAPKMSECYFPLSMTVRLKRCLTNNMHLLLKIFILLLLHGLIFNRLMMGFKFRK